MAYLHNLPIPGRMVKQAHDWHLRQLRVAERKSDAERAARLEHAKAFHPAYHARDGFVRIAEDV